MKKTTYIVMAALALGATLTSCSDDTDPRISTPAAGSFSIEAPANAGSLVDFRDENVAGLTFNAKTPSFGIEHLIVSYRFQVAKSAKDFSAWDEAFKGNLAEGDNTILGADELPLVYTVEHSLYATPLVIDATNLCPGINAVYGFGEDTPQNDAVAVAVRAVAFINNAPSSAIASNIVELPQVFSIVPRTAPEFLYTPGQANGWGFGDDNMRLFTDNDQDYQGFAYVDTEFKITAGPDWATNWGIDDSGAFAPGGGNIKVDTNGLYYLNVNILTPSLASTLITKVGVIGDFNSWQDDVALTPNDNFTVWTGDIDLSGDGWKFRMNGGWDINLGGEEGNLTFGGGNIPVAAPGTYTITLDLSTLPYKCTVTPK